MTKMNIVLLKLFCKAITLKVPNELLEMAAQEAIDELPDFFEKESAPQINKVLDSFGMEIISGVKDVIEANEQEDVSIYFNKDSSYISEEFIKQYQKGKMYFEYDEDEMVQIKEGLALYLKEFREWIVTNPDTHVKLINILNQKIIDQEKQIKKNSEDIKNVKKDIPPNLSRMGLNISDKSINVKMGKLFERFYSGDQYSIKENFQEDNYRRRTLNSECICIEDYYKNEEIENDKVLLKDILSIIAENRLLLITGYYGTGKTVLMKSLFFEYEKDKRYKSYYYSASIIVDIWDSILQNNEYKKNVSNIKLYVWDEFEKIFLNSCKSQNEKIINVFIDDLDELNFQALDNNQSYLTLFLKWIVQFSGKNPGYQIILASRLYSKIAKERTLCVADEFFLEQFDNGVETVTIIETTTFSKSAIENIIEMFATANNKVVNYSTIKKDFGKIVNKFKSPIFLYAFMRSYIKEYPKTKSHNYYYYYSEFIGSTKTGRYRINNGDNISDENILNLRNIAYTILLDHNAYIMQELYRDKIDDEQPILSETIESIKFYIDSRKLDKNDIEKASLINSFFFKVSSNRVYFTDTNIMFSLAAEFVYESLNDLAKKQEFFSMDDLKTLKWCPLYPQLIDYILFLIQVDRTENGQIIDVYLDSFVTNKSIRTHYVNLVQDNEKEQNNSIIEKIILLYILFIKRNQNSYRDTSYQHIFKEIVYYVNAYKTNMRLSRDGEGKCYSVERYFMNLQIHDAHFRRINFKGYNFKGTKISGKSEFFQCSFNQAVMENLKLQNVQFILCNFDGVDNQRIHIKNDSDKNIIQAIFTTCSFGSCNISGYKLKFVKCIFDGNLEIHDVGNVEFNNCIFAQRLIIKGKNNHKPKVNFSECKICGSISITDYSKEEIKKLSTG